MSDLGEISACYTVSFERRSKHSPARMWRAITDPAEISAWMSYPARVDLRVGGEWHVQFAADDALEGVIVRVEAERALWYSWGRSMLSWELEQDGDGCVYRFVHHGQTPRDIPDEEGLAAGWHAWFDDLDAVLDGRAPAEGAERWEQLKPPYRERLEAVLGAALTPGSG